MDKDEWVARIQVEMDKAFEYCKDCVHVDVCQYYPRVDCERRMILKPRRGKKHE